eukprot:gnl/TRDRNA2_/TRDRNA2_80527_c0_seq1.p1 gnl/TRDRNA2_/TRDRNA2_80527_c0~~gnl/TRDRNA2_/TRDRNA2_80527_c0_seq1.p1  ORF type:complete len:257 (+),score=44.40 gnl/TRDRNA2_/TRDRNA2_80527_c0_seq1:95-772(+)
MVGARSGEVQTVEELCARIDEAVACAQPPATPAEAGAPKAAKRRKLSSDSAPAAAEEEGAPMTPDKRNEHEDWNVAKEIGVIDSVAHAEKAMRSFAWRLTKASFDAPQLTQSSGTPLPTERALKREFSKVQGEFPVSLLHDAVAVASIVAHEVQVRHHPPTPQSPARPPFSPRESLVALSPPSAAAAADQVQPPRVSERRFLPGRRSATRLAPRSSLQRVGLSRR